MKREHLLSGIVAVIALTCTITSALEQPRALGALESNRAGSRSQSDSALIFSNITAGRAHTCGLTLSGAAYCWGSGNSGQLGHGDTANSNIPVAVAAPSDGLALTFSSISAGGGHTCGVTSSGAAYCWGNGNSGQLGHGETEASSLPVAVVAPNGGSKLTFSSISAGRAHTCGLTSSGAAYCWGYDGQLRHGGTPDYPTIPVAVAAPTGGNVTFSKISAGGFHTCGMTSGGAAYCWGSGEYGQLGHGQTDASSIPVAVSAPSGDPTLTFSSISAGGRSTCGLVSSGAAYCWGYGDDGQLGHADTAASSIPIAVAAPSGDRALIFSKISAGTVNTCGVTLSGAAYCWGDGEYGQLGRGDTEASTAPASVSASTDGNVNFSSITVGGFHTCGLTSNGSAYCWGSGNAGQLGNGGAADSSTPVVVHQTGNKR